jgi:hypothetical protein
MQDLEARRAILDQYGRVVFIAKFGKLEYSFNEDQTKKITEARESGKTLTLEEEFKWKWTTLQPRNSRYKEAIFLPSKQILEVKEDGVIFSAFDEDGESVSSRLVKWDWFHL